MTKKIVSRQEAIANGSKRFFTGKSCRNGHVAERSVSGNYCVECNKKSVKNWRKKTGYRVDPEYFARWQRENRLKMRNYEQRRCKSKRSERSRRGTRFRKQSTPEWLTRDQKKEINSIYEHARDCQIVTGEKYEVDHIVPIRSNLVCGLHVPWNLQVLPMSVNRSKSNQISEV